MNRYPVLDACRNGGGGIVREGIGPCTEWEGALYKEGPVQKVQYFMDNGHIRTVPLPH